MQEAALPHGKLRGEEVKPPLRAALRAGQFLLEGEWSHFARAEAVREYSVAVFCHHAPL